MTYSGDPSTSDRDALRFLIADTDSDVELLTDAELDYLIRVWLPKTDSLMAVAAVAAEQLATKFSALVDVSADGVSVSTAQLAQRYAEMAVRLRTQAKLETLGGELNLANLMAGTKLDQGIDPLTFARGMHDNPMAGQQDYGGVINPWEQAVARALGY